MSIVKRVIVVKLGLYDGGVFLRYEGQGIATDTAKSMAVMIAGFRQCIDLIGEWAMFIKYEPRLRAD